MTATFIPTLQHILLAKTAIDICSDPEIRCSIDKLDFLFDKFSGETTWEDILDKAAKKVFNLHLPPRLRQRVLAVIKPIALEIARWKYDHLCLLTGDFEFENCQLYWKAEGIIDRQTTAQKLILNKNLDKVNRYFLACLYCSEKDVKMIRESMTPQEESGVLGLRHNFYVSFWNCWIKKGGLINWSELVQKLVNRLYPSSIYNYHLDPVWFRPFYLKLTTEEKKQCINYTVDNTFQEHDDFHFIISQLNENQVESVFKEAPCRLLRFFLNWPYQSLFLETAEQMWKYLQETDFRYLLHFIIYNRIVADWCDFDYVGLLKDFWCRSPKQFKDYIRKDPIFEPVNISISLDFLQCIPKGKLRQCSYRIQPPNNKSWLLLHGDFFHTN